MHVNRVTTSRSSGPDSASSGPVEGRAHWRLCGVVAAFLVVRAMLNARASWNDALYPGTLRSGHEAKKPPYHTQTKAPPAPGSWADSSDMTRQFHDPTTHHSHQSHRTSTTPREAIVLLVRPRVATSTAFRHKVPYNLLQCHASPDRLCHMTLQDTAESPT